MRRKLILSAAIALGSAALFAGTAFAGEWGCGRCGVYAPVPVTYAAPIVFYAAPTYTIVPHYVVQPNYVVERTYVIRQTQYIREPAPCLFACGGRYVVNQGQYAEPAPLAPAVFAPAAYPRYAPAAYPGYYHRYYHRYAPVNRRYYAPRYYGPHVYRGYLRHERRAAVTTYRVNRHAAHRVYRRTYYK